MKERLISLAWAAPWMLFMGFPLAYALELPDPAQRAAPWNCRIRPSARASSDYVPFSRSLTRRRG